eukprot:220163-Hanusia_phi.AAC.2
MASISRVVAISDTRLPPRDDGVTLSYRFYGHDLPGLQEQMQLLLLNNDIDRFPTNCGGRGDHTLRICPCNYKYASMMVPLMTLIVDDL